MERVLLRLEAAQLGTCCALCGAARVPALLPVGHSTRRVLRALASHTGSTTSAQCASRDVERWPDRPELKVTASERLASAPDSEFPSTFPLQFVEQHTGLKVRSVSTVDFAAEWREQFRSILDSKNAAAQHDEFWATGASNGRALQWRVLEIPPQSAYPLHIHPGIEVYLVVRGVLV